jgi:hypothetical protein
MDEPSMASEHERRKPRSQGPADYSPRRQIENLLDQLQAQTRRLRDLWDAREASQLRILAGQLSQAAEGDAAISGSAAEIEAMLLAEEAEAAAMCERVEALIGQCRKAAKSK